MPFKIRFQLLGRCPIEPGETVPMATSQELVQVLVLSGEPSVGGLGVRLAGRVNLYWNLQLSKQLEQIYILAS